MFGTQFTLGCGFQLWIDRFLDQGAYPFMVPVLRNFVLPHGTAIAFLVAYGELAIGLGLVLDSWCARPAYAESCICWPYCFHPTTLVRTPLSGSTLGRRSIIWYSHFASMH